MQELKTSQGLLERPIGSVGKSVADVIQESAARGRPLNVFVMDLWCYTPYYDRYLCESLNREHVKVTLGSVSYFKDPSYLANCGVRHDPGLLDVVAKLRLSNQTMRRALMLVECCINMLALLVRFAFSKPDIIHVQWIPMAKKLPFELWFLKMSKQMGIRLVYTVHDVLPHDSSEKYKLLFQRIYQKMDALICHTSEVKDRLVSEFSLPPNRVWVIPHGPLFHDAVRPTVGEARARLGFRPGVCVVLWQGIIRPYKGIDFLLEAWREIQANDLNARLVIAGPGAEPSDEQAVREAVARLGLEKTVQLNLNFIPVEELPVYYQAADILVYPYKAITTSGALMTGLSYRKPIVATSLRCFQEALGGGGAMVDYGDINGLAATLNRVIRDPAERARICIREGGHSDACTPWTQIAQRTRQCYASLWGA